MNAHDNRFDAPPTTGVRSDWTLEGANRALVLVKRIAADVVEGYARLTELQEIIDSQHCGGAGAPVRDAQEEIVAVADRLRHWVAEMDAVGAELKDWASGIVDFPGRADGRKVCFCWRLGEAGVAHWHEPDEGFAQRRGVDTLETAMAAGNE